MPRNPVAVPPDRIDPLHPVHDAVALNPAPTEIVAEWPPGTFLENLAPGVDGDNWFVTASRYTESARTNRCTPRPNSIEHPRALCRTHRWAL